MAYESMFLTVQIGLAVLFNKNPSNMSEYVQKFEGSPYIQRFIQYPKYPTLSGISVQPNPPSSVKPLLGMFKLLVWLHAHCSLTKRTLSLHKS